MTVEIDGVDVLALAEIGVLIGGIVSTLVIGLLVYLLVRPPRHVREAPSQPSELQDSEAEALIGLMERMEARLEVLERALADHNQVETTEEQPMLEMAADGHGARRRR